MDKEEIAFRKMAMFMQAAKRAKQEEEAIEELKHAAFEVLLTNPGIDDKEWVGNLLLRYSSEVIDAFGREPEKIHSSLFKLWKTDYHDNLSRLTRTFEEWSKAFSTEESVSMYQEMIGMSK